MKEHQCGVTTTELVTDSYLASLLRYIYLEGSVYCMCVFVCVTENELIM